MQQTVPTATLTSTETAGGDNPARPQIRQNNHAAAASQ